MKLVDRHCRGEYRGDPADGPVLARKARAEERNFNNYGSEPCQFRDAIS